MSKNLNIIIGNKKYYLPKKVFNLIFDISIERDAYKHQVKELQKEVHELKKQIAKTAKKA